ncbi:hypothetical protein HN51_012232 [Arachis hypogaea]
MYKGQLLLNRKIVAQMGILKGNCLLMIANEINIYKIGEKNHMDIVNLAWAALMYGEEVDFKGIQQRIGPEYTGPLGVLQALADGTKLLFKESLIPSRGDTRSRSASETMGDKLHRREGNSPDHQLRPLNDRSVIKEVGVQRQPGGLPRSSHP